MDGLQNASQIKKWVKAAQRYLFLVKMKEAAEQWDGVRQAAKPDRLLLMSRNKLLALSY